MMPLENRREAILSLALKADDLGYDAIFLPETWGFDTTVLLSEIAVRTETLKIGTGILSVWGRSAGTIAMASSTLNAVSNGRFILGLGSSTRQLAEGLHDVIYTAPYTKLRQIITQVRALTEGGRIPLALVSDSRPLRLNFPEGFDLPIYLAASSERSIRIAGELCDGWIPFLYPRSHLEHGVSLMREGAEKAGSVVNDWQINPIIPTIVAEDTGTAREGAAWVLVFYLKMMGPIYRNVLSRFGLSDAVYRVLEESSGKGTSIVPSEAEVLLDQLTLYGTPQEVQQKIPLWYEAGASMPCLMLNPNLPIEEVTYSVQALQNEGHP
jgi:alkanesulfonate monooxygenase SsuD/methylene tetrahydromethanopterin reductase-like flavin-dependent oxidoreductase (luciferase family)